MVWFWEVGGDESKDAAGHLLVPALDAHRERAAPSTVG